MEGPLHPESVFVPESVRTMTAVKADQTTRLDSLSYGSYGACWKKEKNPRVISSQPWIKPEMNLVHVIKEKVMAILPQSASRHAVKEVQSLDESKHILRELALELNRVSQHKSRAIVSSVTEDSCSLQECQHFILQWAEELRNLPQRKEEHKAQIPVGQSSNHTSQDARSAVKQQQAQHLCSPAQEEKLKEAQLILNKWAWSLRSLQENSVCPGEEMSAVLKELEKQWKKGRLPNVLPVLEFIMWSLIQDQPQEGSVPQLWLKGIRKYKNKAAFQHIPSSVWKWICMERADIRLDPDTANPDLKVSADGKTVKMDTIIESKHNPRDGYHRHLTI
ncbi:hypothetical protein MATL_G00178880 [Megalops atlanticus]|uniref:Uncharacterized protein n=1 Tax=Megalops atlanticus TaxID=7932 RepID=A0A9D3PR83_MEGAT|nr:hypothetical protein MATL_G00178880 [Megalops atlanticus]